MCFVVSSRETDKKCETRRYYMLCQGWSLFLRKIRSLSVVEQRRKVKAMTPMRQLMGEVLRTCRRAQGMTLRDLSSKARVSLSYISEIERGQKEPSSELLAALADALEIPLSNVLSQVSSLLELEEATEFATVAELSAKDVAMSAA